MLFNPPSWWHHVTNLENSIGVGFRWFSPLGTLKVVLPKPFLLFCQQIPNMDSNKKPNRFCKKIFKYMNKKHELSMKVLLTGATGLGFRTLERLAKLPSVVSIIATGRTLSEQKSHHLK